MSDTDLQNAIADVMNGILSSSRERKKAMASTSAYYHKLMQDKESLKDRGVANYHHDKDAIEPFEQAILTVYDVPVEHEERFAEVFREAYFFESHVRTLCEKFEGSACCADKGRGVVSQYLRYLRLGPASLRWEPEADDVYWLPRFGSREQWFALLEGLYQMRFGRAVPFVQAYGALMMAGAEKVQSK